MKERPILFSGPMVRAVLDGSKTQTRRIIKPQPPIDCSITVGAYHPTVVDRHGEEQPGPESFGAWTTDGEWAIRCPYGQPGDRLWVREAWAETDLHDGTPVVAYAAGGCIAVGRAGDRIDYLIHDYAWTDTPHVERWRPSTNMPRWASRITLEITGVRVERLNDISEADAIAEGLTRISKDGCATKWGVPGWEWQRCRFDPCLAYANLWEQINGDGSWSANPWVWVIEFKRVT